MRLSMFDVQILGMDMYRILHTFVLFSFLGYLMECVVLSIEKNGWYWIGDS